VIISPNAKRDYVVPYSLLASPVPGDSIIRVLSKRSVFDYLISNYCQAEMWVRRRCKLLKMLFIYSTVTPGVAGSSPVRSVIPAQKVYDCSNLNARAALVRLVLFRADKSVACLNKFKCKQNRKFKKKRAFRFYVSYKMIPNSLNGSSVSAKVSVLAQ